MQWGDGTNVRSAQSVKSGNETENKRYMIAESDFKKSTLPPDDEWLLGLKAYHESGHAIVAWEVGLDWVWGIYVTPRLAQMEPKGAPAVHKAAENDPALRQCLLATVLGGPAAGALFEKPYPAPSYIPTPRMPNDDESKVAALTAGYDGMQTQAQAQVNAIFSRPDVLRGLDALAKALIEKFYRHPAKPYLPATILMGDEAKAIYERGKNEG